MAKKTWSKMTPKERRIALARDVIAQLEAERLTAKGGHYIDDHKWQGPSNEKPTARGISELQKHCTVCARGALLIRRVALFNKLSWGNMSIRTREERKLYGNRFRSCSKGQTTDGLIGAFDYRQLALIEGAFEMSSVLAVISNPLESAEQAEAFGKQFPEHNDRLLVIMQNIVDHDGTFDPTVEYEIVYS